MLRNLLDEVIRRRLWPILVVAVLIAVAAPVLFLKPAPSDAPPASAAAPAAAPAGELPARAQRLLTGSDAETAASWRTSSRKSDPFQAPSSHTDTKAAATVAGSKSKQTTATAPGAAPGGTQPSAASGSAPVPTTPQAVPPPIGGDAVSTPARAVDVRFGERMPGRLHRGIPRFQTFVADGRIIAMFLKYSPKRDKAVFAIAPGTLIDGTIECRRKEGLCRYVDIPAGKGVRLITRGSGSTIVIRRLDVVRIVRPAQSDATATASSASAAGTCLLGKLLALGVRDLPPASDACAG